MTDAVKVTALPTDVGAVAGSKSTVQDGVGVGGAVPVGVPLPGPQQPMYSTGFTAQAPLPVSYVQLVNLIVVLHTPAVLQGTVAENATQPPSFSRPGIHIYLHGP
ncbi:hypothetical protein A2V61_02055 [Candidatus Woesebacteria bacterium RBG_19FT_COMBO_47_8]|uniref:Uncharacterized protein n=1 Tax=Candidatus Woesebacteria bacterium RBG_13_46_13 TaxID=1802479 RepID=A0A1F7X475_9BACT|nr:MAG: hypothetical protein A2Y68_00535 [Candidatus Woesebacteria bacterium RBG_13_46_13]OGM18208.1 MAG: hypothetical protein A2V61_02055 [Candidatus Woesebacteria bacterium RBG_19FT_COMBO_47_8]